MSDAQDERSAVTSGPDTPSTPTPERAARPRMRRKTALTVLGAVVAVALLVVLPAFVSASPSFFGSYSELEGEYESWAASPHAEAGCEECHVPPELLARTGYRLLMVGQVYLSPMNPSPPDIFKTPTNDACLACHNDLRTVSPEGDLQIPHRAHVTILEMDCVECHDFLVHKESPSGGHVPEMEGCLKCHDGDRAKDNCTACHTEKAAPPSHSANDWLVVHPRDPADPECAKCHDWAGGWCAQCHESRPKSHGTDWRATHGDRVKLRRNCEACHADTFCIECHGVVPPLNYDPALKRVE